MNKNFNKVLMAIVLFSMTSFLLADDNNALADWTKVGIGAKAMAMGGTGTAYMDNISNAYWNPAGLARIKTFEFGSTYIDGLGWDRTRNFAAFGFRMRSGYAALSWNNANVTDIEGRDENDNLTEDFDNNEHNFALSYAHDFLNVKIGITAKGYASTMEDDTETGFGADIGMIYDINQYMSLGAAFRDVYSKIGDDEVPHLFTIGAAIYPIKNVTLAMDMNREKHTDDTMISLGAEYWASFGGDEEVGSGLSEINNKENTKWEDIMSDTEGGIRAGLNDGNLTCGFGLRFKMLETNYAFVTAGEDFSEDSHIFSLIFKF